MTISDRTLEALIDLVEIKLSCMEVCDREDVRELANLEYCLDELKSIMSGARHGDAVVAFAGLDPGVRSSDGTRHNLRLSKAGSPLLRWIMIQLAQRLKRSTTRWRRMYDKLERRIGNKKATCAIARRLLLTMYAMLRDGRAYQMPAAA